MAIATLSRQLNDVLWYLPLVSDPAVPSDSYTMDSRLIKIRAVAATALSLIAMAALSWACPPVALFAANHSVIVGGGIFSLYCLFAGLEIWRAGQTLDFHAVEEYNKPIPPSEATDHIATHPEAFRRIIAKGENLQKLDAKGMNLATKILSDWHPNSEICLSLLATNIDLLSVNAEGVSLFMHVVANLSPAILKHILSTGKVKAENISEQDQAAIWKHVIHERTMRLLHQYGFNIHAKDAEGMTPLIHWAKTYHLPLCIAFINDGHNPAVGLNNKASQLVPPNTLVHSLLLQAERDFGKLPIRGDEEYPKEEGWMAWLPWKPLVCKGPVCFEPDTDAWMQRVVIVSAVAVAIILLTPQAFLGTVLNVMLCGAAVATPLLINELFYRGEREAERQAVREYIDNRIPSHQATTTICTHAAAAHLMAQHPRHLDKIDETGTSLLGYHRTDPEIFRLLLDKGADFLAGTDTNGLLRAVASREQYLLNHILSNYAREQKVKAMGPELEVKMWKAVPSTEKARWLRERGFNVNTPDAEGNTALMHLVRESRGEEIPLETIQALLDVGANPNLKNMKGETAKTLAIDHRVQARLNSVLATP